MRVRRSMIQCVIKNHFRGCYLTGMYLEGARWDMVGNCLEESKPKEMFSKMPVINCKAGLAAEGAGEKNVYRDENGLTIIHKNNLPDMSEDLRPPALLNTLYIAGSEARPSVLFASSLSSRPPRHLPSPQQELGRSYTGRLHVVQTLFGQD